MHDYKQTFLLTAARIFLRFTKFLIMLSLMHKMVIYGYTNNKCS
jgi:hypothetical protein